jgi:hypothetical protein
VGTEWVPRTGSAAIRAGCHAQGAQRFVRADPSDGLCVRRVSTHESAACGVLPVRGTPAMPILGV